MFQWRREPSLPAERHAWRSKECQYSSHEPPRCFQVARGVALLRCDSQHYRLCVSTHFGSLASESQSVRSNLFPSCLTKKKPTKPRISNTILFLAASCRTTPRATLLAFILHPQQNHDPPTSCSHASPRPPLHLAYALRIPVSIPTTITKRSIGLTRAL